MIEIKKSMLTMGSIICLLLLVSISYQPIVADEPIIDKLSNINEIKKSTNKISKLNNLYIRMIKSYIQSNDDCDCNNEDDSFICYMLGALFWAIFGFYSVIFFIIREIPKKIGEIIEEIFYYLFLATVTPIGVLYYSLDCPPVGFPPNTND